MRFRHHRQTKAFTDVQGIAVVSNEPASDSSEPRRISLHRPRRQCHLGQIHHESQWNRACVTRSFVSLANGPTNAALQSHGHRVLNVLKFDTQHWRYPVEHNVFRGAFSISPHRVVQLACHRKAGVSCCSRRSLEVTRAFAMPFNGQCPNMVRVEDSQGFNTAYRLARENTTGDQPAHLNSVKDAEVRIERKKQSPDFEVEIWASPIGGTAGCWITGRYPR